MNITFRGVELRVEGHHTKGSMGDWNNESVSDTFEIWEVLAGDVNITSLLDMEQIEALERVIIGQL
tara:strand:- start:581 stop:778 length:198 start_codon:yes stop_codon:yes gene_type:complete